jgi:hypothetical protein
VWQKLYQDPIISGLLSAAVLAVLGWVWRRSLKQLKSNFGHIEGEWFGHVLAANKSILVVHEILFELSLNPFQKFKVFMEEKTEESFRYTGKANAIDRHVFCHMTGVSQFDEAFLVLRVPFNRGQKLDYINGILGGVTHNSFPGATFILLARSRLSIETVVAELPKVSGPIIVDADPQQVEGRKIKPKEAISAS